MDMLIYREFHVEVYFLILQLNEINGMPSYLNQNLFEFVQYKNNHTIMRFRK